MRKRKLKLLNMKSVNGKVMIGWVGTILVSVLVAPVALAASYVLPPADVDVIGAVTTVRAEHHETLLDIARAHDLGFEDIVRANPGLDPWIPGEGTEVILPTRFILPRAPREGVVLNLPELRMYYYPKPAKGETPMVVTYPISIGRMDWQTPMGETRIVRKVANPSWYPPESIRKEHAEDGRPLPKVVPAGPDNPLGAFALRLAIPGYLIHSTNKPAGVGMRVTHGCIRMYPEDIEVLFGNVAVGEKVLIVNQPYKVGWSLDGLYLEAHMPLEEDAETLGKDLTSVTEMLVAATSKRNGPVDWDRVRVIFEQADGLPRSMSDDAGGAVHEGVEAAAKMP
jgi:L,D-transpeptidase ErfK/SrfK